MKKKGGGKKIAKIWNEKTGKKEEKEEGTGMAEGIEPEKGD